MRFYSYLFEETYTHSTHIEELFVTRGRDGLQACIVGFEELVLSLGSKNPPISLKIDGSPSIVSGYLGNEFFVASKSLFNKTPKINFSIEDIDKNHPSGPNKQLKICFKYLKSIMPRNKIFQGDYLYGKQDLKLVGQYVTFHPNTIIYSIARSSSLGQMIRSSKMGICFHTEYECNTLDPKDIKLKGHSVDLREFGQNNDVFLLDANVENVSNDISFTSQERNSYNSLLAKVKSSSIDWRLLEEHKKTILIFNNFCVRNGTYGNLDAKEMSSFYVSWLLTRNPEFKGFNNTQSKSLISIFELLLNLLKMKMLLMSKFNQVSELQTFVKKSNGDLVVTSQEGYVVTSGPAQSTKLVDRLEFSRNNFSSEIVKAFSR